MSFSQCQSRQISQIQLGTLFSQPKTSCGQSFSITDSADSSNYARYFSHFQREQQEQDEFSLFWSVTITCLLYLKRQSLNTQLHDELLGHKLSHFFDMKHLVPTPTNYVGERLMHNGYFLAAFAIYWSRLRNSKTVLKYYNCMFSKYSITMGRSELFWYLTGEAISLNSQQQVRKESQTEQKPIIRNKIQVNESTFSWP